MCIDPEGYILGSCNSAGYVRMSELTIRNIDIYNVYTRETKRIMNLDRTVSTLSFYRQGKKYGSNSPLKLASLYLLREI